MVVQLAVLPHVGHVGSNETLKLAQGKFQRHILLVLLHQLIVHAIKLPPHCQSLQFVVFLYYYKKPQLTLTTNERLIAPNMTNSRSWERARRQTKDKNDTAH